MTRRDRLRRVVIVCASFARNLAYYRVGQEPGSSALHAPAHPHASFWRQANGNFLDLCVLEWCKLFGERKGEHGWQQIVADPTAFETGLLAHLGMSATTFNAHIETMRRYRDKFVAYLDSDAVMQIPTLSTAQGSAWFYHAHVVVHEAAARDLTGLPDAAAKLAQGYAQCADEARQVYRRASADGLQQEMNHYRTPSAR